MLVWQERKPTKDLQRLDSADVFRGSETPETSAENSRDFDENPFIWKSDVIGHSETSKGIRPVCYANVSKNVSYGSDSALGI